MFYTYVLRSRKDNKFYYGYTADLKLRIEQHKSGEVKATKNRLPVDLVYYEACLSQEDALRREKYFKTYHGRMYIKKRLKSYFLLLNSDSINLEK
jgi:putative endonuclease